MLLYMSIALQGFWQASYGPHGIEIVWVVSRDVLPMRVGRYAHRRKLEGLKVRMAGTAHPLPLHCFIF